MDVILYYKKNTEQVQKFNYNDQNQGKQNIRTNQNPCSVSQKKKSASNYKNKRKERKKRPKG